MAFSSEYSLPFFAVLAISQITASCGYAPGLSETMDNASHIFFSCTASGTDVRTGAQWTYTTSPFNNAVSQVLVNVSKEDTGGKITGWPSLTLKKIGTDTFNVDQKVTVKLANKRNGAKGIIVTHHSISLVLNQEQSSCSSQWRDSIEPNPNPLKPVDLRNSPDLMSWLNGNWRIQGSIAGVDPKLAEIKLVGMHKGGGSMDTWVAMDAKFKAEVTDKGRGAPSWYQGGMALFAVIQLIADGVRIVEAAKNGGWQRTTMFIKTLPRNYTFLPAVQTFLNKECMPQSASFPGVIIEFYQRVPGDALARDTRSYACLSAWQNSSTHMIRLPMINRDGNRSVTTDWVRF